MRCRATTGVNTRTAASLVSATINHSLSRYAARKLASCKPQDHCHTRTKNQNQKLQRGPRIESQSIEKPAVPVELSRSALVGPSRASQPRQAVCVKSTPTEHNYE